MAVHLNIYTISIDDDSDFFVTDLLYLLSRIFSKILFYAWKANLIPDNTGGMTNNLVIQLSGKYWQIISL